MIDVDVAPTSFSHVHDLDDRCEAREFGNGPSVPMKLFATAGLIVWPGSRAYHLSIHNKIDTSFARIFATTDEEVDEPALHSERRRD
jgi:hypothetical protein